jgi:hypothetical protein
MVDIVIIIAFVLFGMFASLMTNLGKGDKTDETSR